MMFGDYRHDLPVKAELMKLETDFKRALGLKELSEDQQETYNLLLEKYLIKFKQDPAEREVDLSLYEPARYVVKI